MPKLSGTFPPATSASVIPHVLCTSTFHPYCDVIGDVSCHVFSEEKSKVAP